MDGWMDGSVDRLINYLLKIPKLQLWPKKKKREVKIH